MEQLGVEVLPGARVDDALELVAGESDAILAALGMTTYRPDGTYFATTDVSSYGYADGRAFCLTLPEKAGVVAIPSQVFYDDQAEGRHLVRWAFCKRTEVIEEGLRRLGGADLSAG